MYKTHHHLYSCWTSVLTYRALIFIAFVIVFFGSSSSFALAPNPGATCPAGTAQGSFVSSDYTNLVASSSNNNYFNVAGNASGSIPLQMKMTVTESSINNINDSFSAVNNSVVIGRDFPSANDYTDLTLNFRHSTTQQPIYLTNVAMSAFDVDYSNNGSSLFDDYVRITGITQSGSTIDGTLQTITGSNVAYPGGLNNTSTLNCSSRDLDTRCQGSIQFSQAVSTVTVRYTNNTNFITSNPTNQEIQLRLDNYCYVPPVSSYSINKNDGISSIGTNNTSTYTIKVTNTGDTNLTNVVLKDPVAIGLIKETNITCDATDNTSICTTAPTKTQLESASGFTIPSLATGKTYSIKVPTRVTASEGSTVTNTATIQASNLELKSASDTNTVTSIFSGGSPVAAASCPSGHKMFYIGSNPPDYNPKETSSIGWTAGSLDKEYSFGNTKFKLSFTDQINLRAGYPTGTNFTDATTNAINMYHDSFRTNIDHKLTATINKPVSKYGFVVQDLDSNQSGQYIESISLVSSGGVFSRTENKPFQFSNGNQTISGIAWDNCNTASPCNFNIDWGYKPAQTPFTITHGNPSQGSTSNSAGAYVVGYSDFYFCLAPPKVVVNKALTGTRINDTDGNRDQFTISVNSAPLTSFETAGSGQIITNGSSGAISLAENTSYTITERVTGSATGDIANYNAAYTCSNNTTGSSTVMPTSAMAYNATAKTRSFTLANVTYGDEIICTITNSPSVYTFSGFVFNDNGGITDTQANANNATFSSGVYNNTNYFNGVFDLTAPAETGIAGSTVKLVSCSTPTTVYATQAVSATGSYQISASASALSGKTSDLCLIEGRNDTTYPLRTNGEKRTISFVENTYNYPNNNFGRVIEKNVALVLTKYQFINDCSTSINYSTIVDTTDPRNGFSINPIPNNESITPGKCIAYKITATNRANVAINDFIMRDILQLKGVNGAKVTSVLANPALSTVDYTATENPAIGTNGEIKTKTFVLNPRTKRDFYFNTKYGTTQ